MTAQKSTDHFIARQIAYYRARAPEFDLSHHNPTPELRAALDAFAPRGRVLEMACGTGIWTTEILRHPVQELTCIDAAPEMLAIHESRIIDLRAHRQRHDLFTWESAARYDAVIFAFWLSHVPPSRFAEFWGTVRRALKPDGPRLLHRRRSSGGGDRGANPGRRGAGRTADPLRRQFAPCHQGLPRAATARR